MKQHLNASNALPSLVLLSLLQIILIFQTPTSTLAAQVSASNLISLYECNDPLNYTSDSLYESNLINYLFPSLIINGPRSGFLTTSFGQEPDKIFGLVQCRGDITEENCRSCLNYSTETIKQICPNKKSAFVRLPKCVIRYSNTNSFINKSDTDSNYWTWANYDDLIPDRTVYYQQLETLLTNLISNASSIPSRFMTGTISTTFADLSEIYGLVECTQDLSTADCSNCLQVMKNQIRKCCDGYKGVWIRSVSCQISYRDYLFFRRSSPPPPPLLLLPPPPIPSSSTAAVSSSPNVAIVVLTIILAVSLLLLLVALFCIYLVRRKTSRRETTDQAASNITGEESLQFDLVTLVNATSNFSDANKLGEGGFGAVYKGELSDGQEIAVKRLSKYSGQGSQEFKNEVVLLHKLQHRNLVKLMGCCLEGEEKILIYEYVPNRSLDQYLFDPLKSSVLDWKKRYKIIGGIARGLLYLHEDSRLRIVHRDLKAANILLDGEMNPKIADFGTAKLFGVDQTQGNTSRIAGTFGYMPPEYFLHGQFSVKSDVYSFGVLLLETVSGRQISNFQQATNLSSYAWKHWTEGTALQLMDPILTKSFSGDEVMRCIHIGLLCVQESIEDRPTMSSIVLMLHSYSLNLASPAQPAYFQHKATV